MYSAMVAWFNLETRAKANTRCLRSILFNSTHMQEARITLRKTILKASFLCGARELLVDQTFRVSNYSQCIRSTVRVSLYAGSWVHIVFNTNILYLRKAFPAKWWRMTEGVKEMTEMLSKLSCKSTMETNMTFYYEEDTVSYMYIVNYTTFLKIITYIHTHITCSVFLHVLFTIFI